jgi:hypothetical protein
LSDKQGQHILKTHEANKTPKNRYKKIFSQEGQLQFEIGTAH